MAEKSVAADTANTLPVFIMELLKAKWHVCLHGQSQINV
jgi:hypothetical protein